MMECVKNGVDAVQLCAEGLGIDFVIINPIMVNVVTAGDVIIILAGGMAAERALLLVSV